MATCNDCIHVEVCATFAIASETFEISSPERTAISCNDFKARAQFVELKSAVWCKHKPELSKMENFHKQGIGLGMSENSVFWTCSNCGIWGSPIYSFCPHCGARITKEREENA